MIKKKITSIVLIFAVFIVSVIFTGLATQSTSVNATTINFKPKISSFTVHDTVSYSKPMKLNIITNRKDETHWTKKNWNKNYNNWKVQYRLRFIGPTENNKSVIETTSWINTKTFAKKQYFVKGSPDCKTQIKYSAKKHNKPSYYCQIRFVKNNKHTKSSTWKKGKRDVNYRKEQ